VTCKQIVSELRLVYPHPAIFVFSLLLLTWSHLLLFLVNLLQQILVQFM